MGLEAVCEATFGRQRGEGKAHLDPDELAFRGDFRLRIPVKAVKSVEARKGELLVEWPEGCGHLPSRTPPPRNGL